MATITDAVIALDGKIEKWCEVILVASSYFDNHEILGGLIIPVRVESKFYFDIGGYTKGHVDTLAVCSPYWSVLCTADEFRKEAERIEFNLSQNNKDQDYQKAADAFYDIIKGKPNHWRDIFQALYEAKMLVIPNK